MCIYIYTAWRNNFCKTTKQEQFSKLVKVGDMMDVTQNIKVHSLE